MGKNGQAMLRPKKGLELIQNKIEPPRVEPQSHIENQAFKQSRILYKDEVMDTLLTQILKMGSRIPQLLKCCVSVHPYIFSILVNNNTF